MPTNTLQQYFNNTNYTVVNVTAYEARIRISGIGSGFWDVYYQQPVASREFNLKFRLGFIQYQLNVNTANIVNYLGETCIEFNIAELHNGSTYLTELFPNTPYSFVSIAAPIPWSGYETEEIILRVNNTSSALQINFTTLDLYVATVTTASDVFDAQISTNVMWSSGGLADVYVEHIISQNGTIIVDSERIHTIGASTWYTDDLTPNSTYTLTTKVYNSLSDITVRRQSVSTITTDNFSPQYNITNVSQQSFDINFYNLPKLGQYYVALTYNETTVSVISDYNPQTWQFRDRTTINMPRFTNILPAATTSAVNLVIIPQFAIGYTYTSSFNVTTATDVLTASVPQASIFDISFDLSTIDSLIGYDYLDDLTYIVSFVSVAATVTATAEKQSGVQTVNINTNNGLLPYTRYTITVNVYDSFNLSRVVTSYSIGTVRTNGIAADATFSFVDYTGTFQITTEYEFSNLLTYTYQLGNGAWSSEIPFNTPSQIIVSYLNTTYSLNYNILYNHQIVSDVYTVQATTPELVTKVLISAAAYHTVTIYTTNILNGVYWVKYITKDLNEQVIDTSDYIPITVPSVGPYGQYIVSNLDSNKQYRTYAEYYQKPSGTYALVGETDISIHTDAPGCVITTVSSAYSSAQFSVSGPFEQLNLYMKYNLYSTHGKHWAEDRTIDLTSTTTINVDDLLLNTQYEIVGEIYEFNYADMIETISDQFSTHELEYEFNIDALSETEVQGTFTISSPVIATQTYQITGQDFDSTETTFTGTTFTCTVPYANTEYIATIRVYINNNLVKTIQESVASWVLRTDIVQESIDQHSLTMGITAQLSGRYYMIINRVLPSGSALYANEVNLGSTPQLITDTNLIGNQTYSYDIKIYQKLQSKASFLPLSTNSILVYESTKYFTTTGIDVSINTIAVHSQSLNFAIAIGNNTYSDTYIVEWHICAGSVRRITLDELPNIRRAAIYSEYNIQVSGALTTVPVVAQNLTPNSTYTLIGYITNAAGTSSGLAYNIATTKPAVSATCEEHTNNFTINLNNLGQLSYSVQYNIYQGNSLRDSGTESITQLDTYQWNTHEVLATGTTYRIRLAIYDLAISSTVPESTLDFAATTTGPQVIITSEPWATGVKVKIDNRDNKAYKLDLTLNGITKHAEVSKQHSTNVAFDNLVPNTNYTLTYTVIEEEVVIYTGTHEFTTKEFEYTITPTINAFACYLVLDSCISTYQISANWQVNIYTNTSTPRLIYSTTVTQSGAPVEIYTNLLRPNVDYKAIINFSWNGESHDINYYFTTPNFSVGIRLEEARYQSVVCKITNLLSDVSYNFHFEIQEASISTQEKYIDNTNAKHLMRVNGPLCNIPDDGVSSLSKNTTYTLTAVIKPSTYSAEEQAVRFDTTISTGAATSSQFKFIQAIPQYYTVDGYGNTYNGVRVTVDTTQIEDALIYEFTVKNVDESITYGVYRIVKYAGIQRIMEFIANGILPFFTQCKCFLQVYEYDFPDVPLLQPAIAREFQSPSPNLKFRWYNLRSDGVLACRCDVYHPDLLSNFTYNVSIREIDSQTKYTSITAQCDTEVFISNIPRNYKTYVLEGNLYYNNILVQTITEQWDPSTQDPLYLHGGISYHSITAYFLNLKENETYNVEYRLYDAETEEYITKINLYNQTFVGGTIYLNATFNGLVSGKLYKIVAVLSGGMNITEGIKIHTQKISGCKVEYRPITTDNLHLLINEMPNDIPKMIDVYYKLPTESEYTFDGHVDLPQFASSGIEQFGKTSYDYKINAELFGNIDYDIKVVISELNDTINSQTITLTVLTPGETEIEIRNIQKTSLECRLYPMVNNITGLVFKLYRFDTLISTINDFTSSCWDWKTFTNLTPLLTYTVEVTGYNVDGDIIYTKSSEVATIGEKHKVDITRIGFNDYDYRIYDLDPSSTNRYVKVTSIADASVITYLIIPANATEVEQTMVGLTTNTTYIIDTQIFSDSTCLELIGRQSPITITTNTYGELAIISVGSNYITCQTQNYYRGLPTIGYFQYSDNNTTYTQLPGYYYNTAGTKSPIFIINNLQPNTKYYIKLIIRSQWDNSILLETVKEVVTESSTAQILFNDISVTSAEVYLSNALYTDGTQFTWRLMDENYSILNTSNIYTIKNNRSLIWSTNNKLEPQTTYILEAIYDNLVIASTTFITPGYKHGQLVADANNNNSLVVYVQNLEETGEYSFNFIVTKTSSSPETTIYRSNRYSFIGVESPHAVVNNLDAGATYRVDGYIIDKYADSWNITTTITIPQFSGMLNVKHTSNTNATLWLGYAIEADYIRRIDYSIEDQAHSSTYTATGYIYPMMQQSVETSFDNLTAGTSYIATARVYDQNEQLLGQLYTYFTTPIEEEIFNISFSRENNIDRPYRQRNALTITVNGFNPESIYTVYEYFYTSGGDLKFINQFTAENVTSVSKTIDLFESGRQYTVQVSIVRTYPTQASFSLSAQCPIMALPYELSYSSDIGYATVFIAGVDIGQTTHNTMTLTKVGEIEPEQTRQFTIEENYPTIYNQYFYEVYRFDNILPNQKYLCKLYTYDTNNQLLFTRSLEIVGRASHRGIRIDVTSDNSHIMVQYSEFNTQPTIYTYLYDYVEGGYGALIGQDIQSDAQSPYTKTFNNLQLGHTYRLHSVVIWGDDEQHYTNIVSTKTDSRYSGNIWSWETKNAPGNSAEASETIMAYTTLTSDVSTSLFSHKVWNDLIDKIMDVRNFLGLPWDSTYRTFESTKFNENESKIFTSSHLKSAYVNIDHVYTDAVGTILSAAIADGDIARGKPVFGQYLIDLTTYLNAWIVDNQ